MAAFLFFKAPKEEKMKLKTLTKCAVLVALAAVLSYVKVYTLPNGGSITAASMVPIIYAAMTCDFKSAMLTSLVYSVIEMVMGFYPPPTQNFVSFALVVLLDYVVAFGVLGLAGVIAKPFKNRVFGAGFATVFVCFIRFLCHFASGILIWDSYAPEGMPVWQYSLGYNGGYMLAEAIISTIVICLLVKKIAPKENK